MQYLYYIFIKSSISASMHDACRFLLVGGSFFLQSTCVVHHRRAEAVLSADLVLPNLQKYGADDIIPSYKSEGVDFMADIFDYITWRGDLTFEQDPVNCVDSLIFSQMAYFPFDGLWTDDENGEISLAEAQKRLWQRLEEGETPHFQLEKDKKLFPAMAESRRFGSLKLRDFVNRIEPKNEKQFAAVTVLLPGGAFIAYRGTDNTLVGWNEDFNMSFTTPVPSQIDAAKYFAQEASAVEGKLWLGGHSKGGNLAMYAGLFCGDALRSRIAAVYSNDGPGFDGAVVKKEMFQLLDGRLHSFVPQSSVIGMLMEHEEDYVVVRSRQIGILQHDLYSWEVKGPDFVQLDAVKYSSRFLDKTIKEWLTRLEPSQREAFVDAIFNILGSTNANSFSEMKQDILKNSGIILKSVGKLDHENRKMVLNTLSLLLQSAQESLPEFLPEFRPKAPWIE